MGPSSPTRTGYISIIVGRLFGCLKINICCFFLESDAVGLKEKPLSYLLEILHHLCGINMGGIRVLELRVYEFEQANKLESVLGLLNALFKQCK